MSAVPFILLGATGLLLAGVGFFIIYKFYQKL